MGSEFAQARFLRSVQEALSTVAESAGLLAKALEISAGLADGNGDIDVPTIPEARGPRQQDIIDVLWQEDSEDGLKTGEIAKAVDMDQPNAYLTLQALQKQELVEMVPNVQPQRWRLAPTYRMGRQIVDAAAKVGTGEWTTYGDISQVVYGHSRAGLAVARVMGTSPDVENPHRVLKVSGQIPADWRDGELGAEECRRRLEAEGVEVDDELFAHGRHRVDHEELARRLA